MPVPAGTRSGSMPVATSSIELVGRGVVEPDRAAVGLQHLLGGAHHLGQHGEQVERGRQLAGDREDRLHVPRRKAALVGRCVHAAECNRASRHAPGFRGGARPWTKTRPAAISADIEHLSKAVVRLSNELATVRQELAEAKGELREPRRPGAGHDPRGPHHRPGQPARVRAGARRGSAPRAGATAGRCAWCSRRSTAWRASRATWARTRPTTCCAASPAWWATRRASPTSPAAWATTASCSCSPTRRPRWPPGITERIRRAFAAAAPGIAATSATASFGHADWREGDDAPALVQRVEKAFGAARAAGGDRVESA